MAEMLFYNKPEVLNRETHKRLKFKRLSNYNYARQVAAVPLMAVEFPDAARIYPIVFAKANDENLVAMAVLSVNRDGNAFVNDEGQWQATYVPAFVRRYPFVAASMPNNATDFGIAFDAESGAFNENDGEALFNDAGEPTDFLKAQIDFLRNFHGEGQRTQAFCRLLKDEDLLMPLNINIVRGLDKQQFGIRDALAVDEQKLAKLTAEKAHQFLTTGMLGLIYAHLISLRNFVNVANRTGNPDLGQLPWWAR